MMVGGRLSLMSDDSRDSGSDTWSRGRWNMRRAEEDVLADDGPGNWRDGWCGNTLFSLSTSTRAPGRY